MQDFNTHRAQAFSWKGGKVEIIVENSENYTNMKNTPNVEK